MEILTQTQGWLLIGVFFIAMFAILAILPKEQMSKEELYRLSNVSREDFLKMMSKDNVYSAAVKI